MSRKWFLFSFSVLSLVVLLIYTFVDYSGSGGGPKHLCYIDSTPTRTKRDDYLQDVLEHEKQPRPGGRNIFFHETSCAPVHSQIALSAR